MDTPVLPLDHAWHRQRAALRSGGRLRPPPLVAAGLELERGDGGPEVQVGGLVVIFGHFPPSFSDFATLARERLHLNASQAQELRPVLDTRLMALWAWLPGPRQDCYLEIDHATGVLRAWLVGPEGSHLEEIDPEDPPGQLEAWFLDALVLNGPQAWGGTRSLARLVDDHGPRPLLVAAQVADLLDREEAEPLEALALAQERWPRLQDDDELPWADLSDQEHPFVAAQLGRLALRLGMPRAARALLAGAADDGSLPAIVHFDLGQACELVGDLIGAEDAFTRYVGDKATDPDGWRRLLVCRLRSGRTEAALECLARYRSHGGDDSTLAAQSLSQVFGHLQTGTERARCAGWLAARIAPLREGLVDHLATRRFPADDLPFRQAAAAIQADLLQQVPDLPLVAEAALAAVLLSLPLLTPRPPTEDPLAVVDLALAEFNAGVAQHLEGRSLRADPRAVQALAALLG